ncbi:MAG: hypothetical protein ACLQBJ_05210 [Bryobacteraceae bacterium]
MRSLLRFSQLSRARQALVRLCQATNYGQIQHLEITDGEPALSAAQLVLVELKLDSDENPRPELHLADFDLCDEIHLMMERLDAVHNGRIQRIEVRAGIPRRMVLESQFMSSEEVGR